MEETRLGSVSHRTRHCDYIGRTGRGRPGVSPRYCN